MNAKTISQRLDQDLNIAPAPAGLFTFAFDRRPGGGLDKPGWRYTEANFLNLRDAVLHAEAYDGADRGEPTNRLLILKKIAPSEKASPYLADIVASVDVGDSLKRFELDCAKRVLTAKDLEAPGYKEAFTAISDYLEGKIDAWQLDEAAFEIGAQERNNEKVPEIGSRDYKVGELFRVLLTPNEPTDPTQDDLSVTSSAAKVCRLATELARDPKVEMQMQEQSLREQTGRTLAIPQLSQGLSNALAPAKKLPLESIATQLTPEQVRKAEERTQDHLATRHGSPAQPSM